MKTYEVVVIGGGPGGEAAAQRAHARGATTCLIEADKLGGACLNVGCIPTKAMLHAGELAWAMAGAAKLGISSAEVQIDGLAYMKRVADVTAGIVKALDRKYQSPGVELIRGRGRLTGPGAVLVDLNDGGQEELQAGSIIIATGSAPVRPATFPWDSPTVMTTDQAVTAETLPQSVLIVGGGIIGCEFATIYSELGIATTVVEMLDRLAEPLDEDASKLIQRSLRRRKVKVLLGSRIVEMTADQTGVLATTDGGQTIQAACALVAVGRKANIDDIGLAAAGVATADGIIPVDDHCRTNVANIYAIGDAAEKRQYAHLASRMGEVAADNATGLDSADDRSCVPAGVFTHPEVAALGLTEAEAKDQHPGARTAAVQYRATGVAWAYDQTEGLVKIIADGQSGRILGGLVVGYHATEVIAELTTAMRSGLTVGQIAETIHTHPTFAEGVLMAAQKWLSE